MVQYSVNILHNWEEKSHHGSRVGYVALDGYTCVVDCILGAVAAAWRSTLAKVRRNQKLDEEKVQKEKKKVEK